jgi:hypothetical protein
MTAAQSGVRGYLHLVCGEYIARHEFSLEQRTQLDNSSELIRCPVCFLWSTSRRFKPVRLQPR